MSEKARFFSRSATRRKFFRARRRRQKERTFLNADGAANRRVFRALLVLGVAAVAVLTAGVGANGATYQTSNFIVEARSDDLARKIGDSAERFRADLAISWLGQALPNWYRPCLVSVKAGEDLGAGGETVYTVADGHVFDWKMTIQGSEERLLDSVLPHEIMHTIVASYLRKPAPRWLDEGIATSVEASVERANYRTMLATFLHSKRGVAFNDMARTREYPSDLMPFYSQSFSVCEYLILVGGRRRLIEFAKFASETNDWNGALRRYYECDSLGDLQLEWIDWVARWDSANRPNKLPATRKLIDFNDWEREETALANATRSWADVGRDGGKNGIVLASATVPANARPAPDPPRDARVALNGGVRDWGGGDPASFGDSAIRGQEKETRGEIAILSEGSATSPAPVRVEPLVQTSEGGVKWRSVESLSDGAGSATRRAGERR